jgi:CheY-like chemotaxis protein/anti-sigma regulatory factor (Ser/Thr protein kinase)
VRAQFAAQAEAKGLKLLLDECNDLVRTDPTLLQQIVQNLVANAIRYTHEGHVHLRCPDTGAAVRIEVLDTGSGIPREEQERIFEDFYQVPRDSGGRTEGLGLGLSIVRRTADLLGHAVEVESEPGKGSRFTVAVPKGEPRPAAKEPRAEMPRATEQSDGFVLIVDDETPVAQATAMLLEITGHRAIVAASFEEARGWLGEANRAPDVIICDVHLAGGETGPETIRKIRALWSRPIPAVLITGDTSTDATAMLAGLEPCHLLSKPVDGNALLDLVERLT